MQGKDIMVSQKYRLHSIVISNFRGITEERSLDIGGRHLFILGPNGYGKSTIVEAIRWCLFGYPGQQDIEVGNTFYPAKTVEVKLGLLAQSSKLNIRRHITPGSQRARPFITDAEGKEMALKDAFPQLSRLGSPTGTQVIFAAQHASGRSPADIEDFGKLLYYHLGIEEIPKFIGDLRDLVEEHKAEVNEMTKLTEVFAVEVRKNLEQLEGRKEEITRNPPWGKGLLPTRLETENKITSLFQETAALVDETADVNLTFFEKTEKVKAWNEIIASRTNSSIEIKLKELIIKNDEAKRIRNDIQYSVTEIKNIKARICELTDREKNLLRDSSFDDISNALRKAEDAQNQISIQKEIISLYRKYRDRFTPTNCPICNTDLTTTAINDMLIDDDIENARLLDLRRRVADINIIKNEIQSCYQTLNNLEDNYTKLLVSAQKLTGNSQGEMDQLTQIITQYEDNIKALNNQIVDAKSEIDARNRKLLEIQAEDRFHNYQNHVADLQNILGSEIEDTREAIKRYNEFLESAMQIGKLLLDSLDDQINLSLPELSGKMSEVFKRLTAHPSYDGVLITRSPSDRDGIKVGGIERAVTSTKKPGRSFKINVLNGQAIRGLQLVPYFVFSEYWHDLMELDMLLVDDPSESFDTSHLDNLMLVLASVASHTQLVLASHEDDRMVPLIKKYFNENERYILKIQDFDPDKGPTFACG